MAQSTRDVFEALLANQKLTLEFSSPLALRNFKSALQVYKYRANQRNSSLGFGDDVLGGDSICADMISTSPLIVCFYLGKKEPTPSVGFKFISSTL